MAAVSVNGGFESTLRCFSPAHQFSDLGEPGINLHSLMGPSEVPEAVARAAQPGGEA